MLYKRIAMPANASGPRALERYLHYGSWSVATAREGSESPSGSAPLATLRPSARAEEEAPRLRIGHIGGQNISNLSDAAGEMIALSRGAHRNVKNPVAHLAVSWESGETPTPLDIDNCAAYLLERLGLKANQAKWVSHVDTDNTHLHIMVNRLHYDSAARKVRAVDLGFDYLTGDHAMRAFEMAWGFRHTNGPHVVEEGRIVLRPRSELRLSQRSRRFEFESGLESFERWLQGDPKCWITESMSSLGTQLDLQRGLKERFNLRLEERGKGLIVRDVSDPKMVAKACRMGLGIREFGARYGRFQGLTEAAYRYDPAEGISFSRYVRRAAPDLIAADTVTVLGRLLAKHGLLMRLHGAGIRILDAFDVAQSRYVGASLIHRSLSRTALDRRFGTDGLRLIEARVQAGLERDYFDPVADPSPPGQRGYFASRRPLAEGVPSMSTEFGRELHGDFKKYCAAVRALRYEHQEAIGALRARGKQKRAAETDPLRRAIYGAICAADVAELRDRHRNEVARKYPAPTGFRKWVRVIDELGLRDTGYVGAFGSPRSSRPMAGPSPVAWAHEAPLVGERGFDGGGSATNFGRTSFKTHASDLEQLADPRAPDAAAMPPARSVAPSLDSSEFALPRPKRPVRVPLPKPFVHRLSQDDRWTVEPENAPTTPLAKSDIGGQAEVGRANLETQADNVEQSANPLSADHMALPLTAPADTLAPEASEFTGPRPKWPARIPDRERIIHRLVPRDQRTADLVSATSATLDAGAAETTKWKLLDLTKVRAIRRTRPALTSPPLDKPCPDARLGEESSGAFATPGAGLRRAPQIRSSFGL